MPVPRRISLDRLPHVRIAATDGVEKQLTCKPVFLVLFVESRVLVVENIDLAVCCGYRNDDVRVFENVDNTGVC